MSDVKVGVSAYPGQMRVNTCWQEQGENYTIIMCTFQRKFIQFEKLQLVFSFSDGIKLSIFPLIFYSLWELHYGLYLRW